MAKSPRIRHSRDRGEPVTIDLAADAVSEAADEPATAENAEPAATPQHGAVEAAPAEAAPSFTPEPQAAPEPATKSAAPTESAPASQPKAAAPRRGVASLLAAGVIGGLVATGGNWAYDFFNPPTPAAAGPDIADELKARDDKIAAVSAAVDGLKADAEALRTALAGLKPADAPDLAPLAARLEALEKQFAGLAQAGGDPAAAAKFAEVEAKLAELAAAASAASDAARQASDTAAAQAARVDAIAAAVKAVEDKAAAAANNPKIALAIAAAALKSAVDRGQPFMTELETYAAVSPQAPEIAALREFAAAGVPTRADLAAEAGKAAEAMIAAMNAADPQAGFFQRLLDSAKALVTVRPIGMVEGDTVEAIAARMEAKTRSGDLKGALEELAKAPEPAKAAAAAFAARVQGRMTVENLIDAALAAALAAGGNGG